MKEAKIKFSEDKFYKEELIFEKDKVYKIVDEPKGWIQKWLVRGGELVVEADKPEIQDAPKKVEEPPKKEDSKKKKVLSDILK